MKNTLIFLFASLALTFTMQARAQSEGPGNEWKGARKHYLSFQSGDTPSKSAVTIVSDGREKIRIAVEAGKSPDCPDCRSEMKGIEKAGLRNGSFLFEGKKFKGLNQLDREIRYEEFLLRKKGYFKFMDHWYEPLDSLDKISSKEA